MTRRFPFLPQPLGRAGGSAEFWRSYALYILGGLLLYSGAAAVLAWRYVPAGMDPGRWALIAALVAPAWAVAGLAVTLAVDAVSRYIFKRDAISIGLGIVFIGTMLLNAGGGHVGRLMGISLGALFALGLTVCAVFLLIALIRRK
jgi:hypothetical protein